MLHLHPPQGRDLRVVTMVLVVFGNDGDGSCGFYGQPMKRLFSHSYYTEELSSHSRTTPLTHSDTCESTEKHGVMSTHTHK